MDHRRTEHIPVERGFTTPVKGEGEPVGSHLASVAMHGVDRVAGQGERHRAHRRFAGVGIAVHATQVAGGSQEEYGDGGPVRPCGSPCRWARDSRRVITHRCQKILNVCRPVLDGNPRPPPQVPGQGQISGKGETRQGPEDDETLLELDEIRFVIRHAGIILSGIPGGHLPGRPQPVELGWVPVMP